jgi:predicted membrane-bound spermidine synthase
VVIFSMLVSSGLGSFLSRKVVADSNARLIGVLTLAALLVGVLAAIVQPVLSAGVGLPLVVKIIATVLLIAPAGFVMGIPFPTGLRLLEKRHEPSVRWAWSLNAAASVLGSVGALVLALYLGLVETLLIGGGLYLCALAVIVISPMVRESVTRPVSAGVSV